MLADYYCLTQAGKSIIVNTLSKMVYLWNPCYGGRVFVVFFFLKAAHKNGPHQK